MKNITTLFILMVGFALFQSCRSFLPTTILPYSMVEYQPGKFVDETEITVEQWAEFVFDGNEQHKPDSIISSQFSYHQLFYPPKQQDSIYRAFGKIDYFDLPVLSSYFDTLNYVQLRNILDFPISGIRYEDAVSYCQWRTEQYNQKKTMHTKKKIYFSLPDSVVLEPIPPLEVANKYDRKEPVANLSSARFEASRDAPNKLIAKQIGKQPIRAGALPPNEHGVYDFIGNVAEMTGEKGIAYGASYRSTDTVLYNIAYTQPAAWLGFRCVGRVKK